MRVAAASAHLAQVEVNLGLIPGAGGTQHLPRLVGPGRAAELILSGRVVQAEEALAIGLVEAVLPDDGFMDGVLEWVAPIAARPRHALAAAKLAILASRDRPLADGLRLEGRLFIQCQARPDVIAREMAVLEQYRQASPDEQVSF
jgi:enoyl-CoA hydratase/carnithine racemase